MAKNGPHLGGRPKKDINWKQLDEMLHIQCTGEEIAAVLGVSYETIDRHCREYYGKCFEEYSLEKRCGGRASLRRRQWLSAVKDGNTTMLVWLGKNMLDQTDRAKTELTGADGKPIETNTTLKIEVRGI